MITERRKIRERGGEEMREIIQDGERRDRSERRERRESREREVNKEIEGLQP